MKIYETLSITLTVLLHVLMPYTAGRARAGCPVRNIQSTLDGLTRAHSILGGEHGDGRAGPGLTVAVFEESTDFLSQEKNEAPKVSRSVQTRAKIHVLFEV